MPSLEQDAMERVARMYSTQRAPRSERAQPPPDPKPQPEPKPPIKPDPAVPNMLDLLMKDNDRSLIMMLILILMHDGADSMLILALMYIIL